MNEGLIESRARSFVGLWPVAPEYRIVDGHVCPMASGEYLQHGSDHSSKDCQTYLPMARPEIPRELAKAANGREADVLEFVKTYGLLGYAQAFRIPEELVGARLLEGGHDKAEPLLRGDPLSWVLTHAQTVRLLLELLGRLEDAAALRDFVDRLKVRAGKSEHVEYVSARRGYLRPIRTTTRLGEPRGVALHIVASVINGNLSGVSRYLQVEYQDDGGEGFTSLFEPRNLLDCVYWHLADAACGSWVRRCADPQCGAFFVAKSERVRYCPPPFGNQGVSPCMNRHKQRKHRQAVREPLVRRSRKRRNR